MRNEKKEKKIRYPTVLCGVWEGDHVRRGIYMDTNEAGK